MTITGDTNALSCNPVESFERVLARVATEPTSETGRILAGLAASLLDGHMWDTALIEKLLQPADRALCTDLFVSCMRDGLDEENRRSLSAAFAPYIDIHSPGARH